MLNLVSVELPIVTMAVVALGILGGASAATAVCFRRWRFRKQIVPSSYWKRVMGDYGSMEESLQAAGERERRVRVANEELADRFALLTNENQHLRDQTQSLQNDLAVVTNEAALLVDGLHDNQERWASAQDLHSELEFTVSQLHEAKQLLEERLRHRELELRSARLTIAELNQTSERNAELEAQLAQAAERDRGHAAVITRLERLGDQTADQLRAATRRAETAQWQLRHRAVSDAPPMGAFERENAEAMKADLKGPVIDLDLVVDAPPPSVTPQTRVFDRGRSLQNRLQRSYGRLPRSD